MAEPLKNIYTVKFINEFLNSCEKIVSINHRKKIIDFVFDRSWKNLELKDRMQRIADAFNYILPSSFEKAAPIYFNIVKQIKLDFHKGSYEFLFLPIYIEKNGLNYPEISFKLIEDLTQFISCEFAIRPFIINYEQKTMQQLLQWSLHPHEAVRRLSTEGCRSRLPWAPALPKFKKNPKLIVPILENLKTDKSLYVRKSVANNLNDISKDHPTIVLKIAYKWYGQSNETNWVVKHGLRTLLKVGNRKALKLFGFTTPPQDILEKFRLLTPEVDFGESLQFNFNLRNTTKIDLNLRLEYGIYFKKSNSELNRKVFKLSERMLQPQESLNFTKVHKLIKISTRKYYEGQQKICLIINGVEFEKFSFILNM